MSDEFKKAWAERATEEAESDFHYEKLEAEGKYKARLKLIELGIAQRLYVRYDPRKDQYSISHWASKRPTDAEVAAVKKALKRGFRAGHYTYREGI